LIVIKFVRRQIDREPGIASPEVIVWRVVKAANE
jgi:hypothetical protein